MFTMTSIIKFNLVAIFCLIVIALSGQDDPPMDYNKNEIGISFASFSTIKTLEGFNPSLIFKRLINKSVALKTQIDLENSSIQSYWEQQEEEVFITNSLYRSWFYRQNDNRDIIISSGIEVRVKVLPTLSFTGGVDVIGLYQTSSSKRTEHVYLIDSISNAGTIYQTYQKDLIEINTISELKYHGYGLGWGLNAGAIIHLHKKLLMSLQGRMEFLYQSGKSVTLDHLNSTTNESPHKIHGFSLDFLYNKIALYYCF